MFDPALASGDVALECHPTGHTRFDVKGNMRSHQRQVVYTRRFADGTFEQFVRWITDREWQI